MSFSNSYIQDVDKGSKASPAEGDVDKGVAKKVSVGFHCEIFYL
jgi:hypothetical protein